MKLFTLFGKLVLWSMFILFLSCIATFFLSVAMPEEVAEAVKFFQNIFSKHLTQTSLCSIM